MTHSSFIQILWKCLFLFLPCTVLAQERPSLGHWIAEDQSGIMDFTIREDTLELIVPEGLTLWYKDRLTGDYEISFNWGDGVLEDKDKEQAIQLNEVNSGIRKKTDYLKWRYGVDDKQAAEMLPESGVQSFFDEGGGS